MSLPIASLPLFVIGTGTLLWFSRKPLRQRGSHGFYRFFAWEAILAVCVLNRNAHGSQALSELLLQSGLVFFLLGFLTLRLQGRSQTRDDAVAQNTLYGWESTTTLVTSGIYRLIRHPMYSALYALAWGMCLRAFDWLPLVLTLMASYFLLRTAQADELECLAYFGESYQEYMQRTKRFIPWLW